MAESKEELKSFLMRVKEESERASLKLNIKKKKKNRIDHGTWPHHFMANRRGKCESSEFSSSCALKSLQMVTAAMKLKDAHSSEGKL